MRRDRENQIDGTGKKNPINDAIGAPGAAGSSGGELLRDSPAAAGLKTAPLEVSGLSKAAGAILAGNTGMLNENDKKALETAAAMIGVPSEWLFNVVSLETAKKDQSGRVVVTWNPAILNDTTKAGGLIQFMPDTARSLGYKDQYDLIQKHPTIKSQLLGPVVRYFKQFSPFPTEQSFYLSVFFPSYRFKSLDTTFSPIVQKQNPGIKTVGDYVAAVRRFGNIARGIKPGTAAAGTIVALLLIGVTGLLIKRLFMEGKIL